MNAWVNQPVTGWMSEQVRCRVEISCGRMHHTNNNQAKEKNKANNKKLVGGDIARSLLSRYYVSDCVHIFISHVIVERRRAMCRRCDVSSRGRARVTLVPVTHCSRSRPGVDWANVGRTPLSSPHHRPRPAAGGWRSLARGGFGRAKTRYSLQMFRGWTLVVFLWNFGINCVIFWGGLDSGARRGHPSAQRANRSLWRSVHFESSHYSLFNYVRSQYSHVHICCRWSFIENEGGSAQEDRKVGPKKKSVVT